MRLFIMSYLASVAVIILSSLSAVQSAPLDVAPRILFYFGFPAAILVSIVVIAISHLSGISISATVPESMTIEPEGQSDRLDELKVA